jgi:hypothetical protein
MKEGRCFKCRNTGHWATECPEDKNDKAKEEPRKKINRWELHAHVQALLKDMTDEDRKEFLKNAKEAGFQEGKLPRC